MARSMEDILIASTAKAVEAAMKPLVKEIQELKQEVSELKATAKATNETFDPRERLISMTETSRRLGVGKARLRSMIQEGAIKTAQTPNGRRKVLESSINGYITQLQEKTG